MEPLSADAYDALLRDLFGDSSTTTTTASTHSMTSVSNEDLLSDLNAFDALIKSSQDLLREMDAAANTANTACDAGDACLTNECTAGPVVKKPKSAPGGNAARKRQREEIHALRETAELLEKELQALQPRALELPPSYRSPSDTEGGRQHGPDSLSPDQKSPQRWLEKPQQQQQDLKTPFPLQNADEMQLVKEKQARKITELENRRLSKLVDEHKEVTHQFESALRKRRLPMISEVFLATIPTSARSSSFLYFNNPVSAPPPPQTAGDLVTFEALTRNVESRYHDLERVFQVVGLASCRTNMTEARIDTDHDAGGKILEFKSSRVIPFSIHVIDETLLKTGRGANTRKKPETIGQSVTFKKQFQARGTSVNVRGVTKRFMEDDRIVVVWESVSEWGQSEEGSGETVVLQEKAWIVTQAFSEPGSATEKPQPQNRESPLSLLQSYVSMTPIRNGGKRTDDVSRIQSKRTAMLTDVVMPFYEKIFAGRVQHLENLLFEEALLKPKLVAA